MAGLRVRWRLGGGRSAPQLSVTFDSEEEVEHAKALISAHRSNIDKRTLYATVKNIPLTDVETRPAPAVADLVEPFLLSRHGNTPGVVRRNRQMLEFAMVSRIGHLPIDRVTVDDIDAIIAWLRRCDCTGGAIGQLCRRRKNRRDVGPHPDGLGKTTVDRYFVAIKTFFAWTVGRYRDDNPVQGVKWRTLSLSNYNDGKGDDAHFYMSAHQFGILRSAFDERYRPLLDLLIQTGMRFGEATALRKCNVKVEAQPSPRIVICEAWKLGGDGRFYVGLPKNNSPRTIEVHPKLIGILQPILDIRGEHELLFQAPRGGRIESTNFWANFWQPAVTAAMRCELHPVPARGRQALASELKGPKCGDNGGLTDRGRECRALIVPGWNRCGHHLGPDPEAVSSCDCWDRRLPRKPVIHDLRHSNIANLIWKRIPVGAISKRVGHKTQQITETVYAGLLDELKQEVVEASWIGV